jgi:hypothetical protein
LKALRGTAIIEAAGASLVSDRLDDPRASLLS